MMGLSIIQIVTILALIAGLALLLVVQLKRSRSESLSAASASSPEELLKQLLQRHGRPDLLKNQTFTVCFDDHGNPVVVPDKASRLVLVRKDNAVKYAVSEHPELAPAIALVDFDQYANAEDEVSTKIGASPVWVYPVRAINDDEIDISEVFEKAAQGFWEEFAETP